MQVTEDDRSLPVANEFKRLPGDRRGIHQEAGARHLLKEEKEGGRIVVDQGDQPIVGDAFVLHHGNLMSHNCPPPNHLLG